MAVVILALLWERLFDLRDFYTDEGIMPRAELAGRLVDLYRLSGSFAWAATLYALTALATLLLALGWHTRVVTPIVWVLVLSMQRRNPLVLDGGDAFMRVMLFWAMFADWGAAYSLDARAGRGAVRIWSLPVRLLELQLITVYVVTVLRKVTVDDSTWLDGSAV